MACSDYTAQNSNSSLSNSSASAHHPTTLDFMPLNLLAEILFLTLSNRFSLIIPVPQLSFPLQSFSWPTILYYFSSSVQSRHRSLFLPLFPEHSIWDLSYNEKKKIHCNFPFIYQTPFIDWQFFQVRAYFL